MSLLDYFDNQLDYDSRFGVRAKSPSDLLSGEGSIDGVASPVFGNTLSFDQILLIIIVILLLFETGLMWRVATKKAG